MDVIASRELKSEECQERTKKLARYNTEFFLHDGCGMYTRFIPCFDCEKLNNSLFEWIGAIFDDSLIAEKIDDILGQT